MRPPAAVVAWVAALGALAALGVACSDDPAPGLEARVTGGVEVTPNVGPDVAVASDGAVWLPTSEVFQGDAPAEPHHALVRIEPDGLMVTHRVAVPHQMTAVAVGEAAVWATGTDFPPGSEAPRGSVVRIEEGVEEGAAEDESTTVETAGDTAEDEGTAGAGWGIALSVDLGEGASPSDVAFGFGAVWVADGARDRVVRIEPDTGEVAAEVAVGGQPSSLAVTEEAVWVNKPRTGEIRPIDPATNRPLPAVGTGNFPDVLDAGGAGLWVARYTSNDLLLVDAEAGEIATTVSFEHAPSRIEVGDEAVFVTETEGRRLSAVVDGASVTLLEGPSLVALAAARDGTIWAVDQADQQVVRIEVEDTG